MAIFQNKAKAQLQELKLQHAEAQGRRDELEKIKGVLEGKLEKSLHVQELLVDNILTIKEIAGKFVGNDYRDYGNAVQAITEKYNGVSDWGCLQTGTVIDLRAAFILGEGLKVVANTDTKEEAEAELEWAEAFMEYNGLDAEMAQELAKEAEIEGKIALRIFWEAEEFKDYPGMVSTRFISWYSRKYTVIANPDDYLWYEWLTWYAGATYAEGKVPEAEFVYKKFGGRIYDPNNAQPKVMKCLTQIDRLDKALRDLREINHLFASPTPDFKCENAQQVTQLLTWLTDTNWRIGKAIAHVGEFDLKSPDSTGVQNLISEIETLVKMIAGTTGIPIHYFGLLDLLKNRATGDNTRELVMAATTRERAIWIGVFEELLKKAMTMYNERTGEAQKSTKLDPDKIRVEIPLISQDHWANIQNVLIPAALGGIISKDYVASQIPGVDVEKEAEKRQEAEDKEMEQAKADLERIRAEREQGGGGGEGKPGEPGNQAGRFGR